MGAFYFNHKRMYNRNVMKHVKNLLKKRDNSMKKLLLILSMIAPSVQAMERNEDEMVESLTRRKELKIRKKEHRIVKTQGWLDTYYDNTEIDKKREEMMREIDALKPRIHCKEMAIMTCIILTPLVISFAYDSMMGNNMPSSPF
jgi:hypothetical protein